MTTRRLQRWFEPLRERRLPWRMRWIRYIRPGSPRASVRLIRAAYRDDPALGRLMLHAYGLQFLGQTLDACREGGVRPFLAFGTLLGHQRDGGFIAHDADIDLGLVPEDFGKIDSLVASMRARGFAVRLNDDHEVSFYKPLFPTLLVDFFRFYRKGAHAVYYDTRGDTVYEFAFPVQVIDELVPARFMNQLDVWVPRDADAFLTASYGDWRTPRQAFDNVNDHPNLRVV